MSETVWVVAALKGNIEPVSGTITQSLRHGCYVRLPDGWCHSPMFFLTKDVHHTELAAVQDATARLEAIAERKHREADEADVAAGKMRERAKALEGAT